MLKLSAHLGYQFTETPFFERFAQAAQAGYRAIEFPAPYPYDSGHLRDLLDEHGLVMAQFSMPMGGDKEKGIAALEFRNEEFREHLKIALSYAKALDCSLIHPMAGSRAGVLYQSANWQTYCANIEYAAKTFADAGVETLIEVISPFTVPGYYMSSYDLYEALLERLDGTPASLLFDTYHSQNLTGDMQGCLEKWMPHIGHIQIADCPGRHEPGTGALDFNMFFETLERNVYSGWIGCEYVPETTTSQGLHRLARYLKPLRF